MLLTTKELDYNIASIERNKFHIKTPKIEQLQPVSQVYLLQAVIESFVDGILILTNKRELVHANEYARCICRELTLDTAQPNVVPEEVWHVCQSLIESCELFPQAKIILESEIETGFAVKLRMRVRWLPLAASDETLLLVTLEDYYQTSESIAIADAKKYGLTEREAEVWLLRRANFSYKEIASRLYITINTVKKHLKNIYAKQQDMLWSQ